MKLRYRFLLLVLFAIPEILIAQKKNSSNITAIICGTTDSANIVEIQLYPKSIVNNGKLATISNTKVVDHNFKIKILNISEPSYITIVFRYPWRFINSLELYLIEPGDSINISQASNSFYFPGKNSLKFANQFNIKETQSKLSGIVLDRISKHYNYFTLADHLKDSIWSLRLKMLLEYQPTFSKEVYEIIYNDCVYDKWSSYYAEADLLLRLFNKDSAALNEIIRYYSDYYRYNKIDTTNSHRLVKSQKFIEMLTRKVTVDAELALYQYKPAAYQFRKSIDVSACKKIDTDYAGILKQYLFTNYFIKSNISLDSLNDCLSSAIRQTNDPYLSNLLTDVQRKSKGVYPFNFSLPDSTGKKITLSDYKGKVVVIDFWFTGCEWCIEMAKALKILAAEKDPNIIYMTVSVDSNKNIWKESLKKGIFTSNNEINLYTGGLGIEHPLINYYKIYGYPFLMIIDKAGKIFTVNPDIKYGVETRAKNLRKITTDLAKQDL